MHHQGCYGKPMNTYEQHDMMTTTRDEYLRLSGNIVMNTEAYGAQHQSAHYNLRSSRYLIHAQDILHEFCTLELKQNDHSTKAKSQRSTSQFRDHDNYSNNMNTASSSKNIALKTLEFLELQKRKTKLLHMLDEV